MNVMKEKSHNDLLDQTKRREWKRNKTSRRHASLLLSAVMGCSCESSSAFSAMNRNTGSHTEPLAKNSENAHRLLFQVSDDHESDERRREHTQAANIASHDRAVAAKNEGMLSRVTKLVPIAKDDDEVGEYLRFIDRRYHRFHDEEIEHPPASSSSNKSEVGSVGWTWDWLFSTPDSAGRTAQQQHEDVLYVLGLADIASKHVGLNDKPVAISRTKPEEKMAPYLISLPTERHNALRTGTLLLRAIFNKQKAPFRAIIQALRKITLVAASSCATMSRRSIKTSVAKVHSTTLISCAIMMIFIRPILKFLMDSQST